MLDASSNELATKVFVSLNSQEGELTSQQRKVLKYILKHKTNVKTDQQTNVSLLNRWSKQPGTGKLLFYLLLKTERTKQLSPSTEEGVN
jgi:hypothetical protein